MNGMNRVVFGVLATLMLATPACTAISPDGNEPEEASSQDEPTGEATQALGGTQHKLCSAYIPGNWRDTMVVPDSWSAVTCSRWAASQGVTHWQLGCSFADDYSWGGANGASLPSPNCAW